MKKQFITIAAAIAIAFSAGALLADDGIKAGPETLGTTDVTDGVILAQSKFDKLIEKKERKKNKKARARERRKRELERKRLERERLERERRRHHHRDRVSRRPLRVMKSHLSPSSSVRSARRMSSNVRPGERVYFYYRVGPIQTHNRRAPIKTRLVVRKDGRTVYNGTWRKRDAARAGHRGGDLRYYESAQWSYRVARHNAGGRYSATIYFQDVRNRKTTSINYHFTVKRSRHYRGSHGTRYYKRPTPHRATRYNNRSRYGGTRYNNRSRYGGTPNVLP